jgi:hypothetical protein
MISLTSQIQAKQGLVESLVLDERIMLDSDSGQYFVLKKTAVVIWALIQTPIKVDALIVQILKKYEVTPQQAQADVMTFLNDLYSKGLLKVL